MAMLNLTNVRTFLIVIDAKGIRAAAKMLDLSPSTVVEHLKQLEADLAVPLVVRSRGHMRATPEGARFLPYARGLVGTAMRARELLATPVIRLAAASNIGVYLLHQRLAAFRQKTGIEIEMWIGPNPAVAERLDTGAADIAAMEWWDNRRGYEVASWGREALVLIVSPQHRWASRASVSIDELADEPMLGGEPGSGTGTLLRSRLGPAAARLRMVSGFGSTEAVKRAVRAGRGASIVFRAAVVDEVASGQLVALEILGAELYKDLLLIVPEYTPANAPSQSLISELRSPS